MEEFQAHLGKGRSRPKRQEWTEHPDVDQVPQESTTCSREVAATEANPEEARPRPTSFEEADEAIPKGPAGSRFQRRRSEESR
jgi:hypothetical protein